METNGISEAAECSSSCRERKGVYERLLLRESLRDVPTTEERVTNWDYGIES
jgi:hypothetical protein